MRAAASVSLAAVSLLTACTLASAAEPAWKIDPSHTAVQFAVRHLMMSTVRGAFGKVEGLARIDESDPSKSTVEAVIDAASIDTRDEKRDAHLKDTDFLDVVQYPTIVFKSKTVTPVDATHYRVRGDLSLHGVTRPIVLEVEGGLTPTVDPSGSVKLGGIARTTIDRRDFGISFSKTMDSGGLVVGNDVEVTIDVELTRTKIE